MKKNSLLCAIIWGIMATTLPAQTVKKDYTHQVDSVLKLMTVEEKVGQMIQYSNNKLLTGPSLDSRNHTEEIKRGEVGSIFNILTVEPVSYTHLKSVYGVSPKVYKERYKNT